MAWEGIKVLKVERYSNHTNVIRYRTMLTRRYFDIYVPIDLIKSITDEQYPNQLTVVVGNHSPVPGNFGFVPLPSNPLTYANVMVYEDFKSMGHTERYETKYLNKSYSLYVPYEFFDQAELPRRVFLQILL